jgi:hypothetical protein
MQGGLRVAGAALSKAGMFAVCYCRYWWLLAAASGAHLRSHHGASRTQHVCRRQALGSCQCSQGLGTA